MTLEPTVTGTGLSVAERDRRWALLSEAMSAEGLDALVFVSNDHRGHKGGLRYVADYRLVHRFGYAVLRPDEDVVLVLPASMQAGPKGEWAERFRFERDTAAGVASELGAAERVGIVGLRQIMRVEELDALRAHLPSAELEDASELFERVRMVKSREEIQGVAEAAEIGDRCFDRLLEVVRPGITDRLINAELTRVCLAERGDDPLFLTMYAEPRPGESTPAVSAPEDRVLRPADLLQFSIELIGPTGYWIELSRMVTFGGSNGYEALNEAIGRAMGAGRGAMLPGRPLIGVQRAVAGALEEAGLRPAYWSGHGIGLDVIESPWIGEEFAQTSDASPESSRAVEEGMVLALHPHVAAEGPLFGYMADTVVVEAEGARAMSRHPLDLYCL